MDRFFIEWKTVIRDAHEYTEPRDWPIRGRLLYEAEDLVAAAAETTDLVDVDFFCPTQEYSASDPHVLSGEMWLENRPLSSRASDLNQILPHVEEWDFERIVIVKIELDEKYAAERNQAEAAAYEAHREEEGTLTEIEERERELAAERQADRSE